MPQVVTIMRLIWKVGKKLSWRLIEIISLASSQLLIGYEWTTGTQEPETASYHRNVIFNSYIAPVRPFSRFDSSYPEDLWDWMDNLRNNGD